MRNFDRRVFAPEAGGGAGPNGGAGGQATGTGAPGGGQSNGAVAPGAAAAPDWIGGLDPAGRETVAAKGWKTPADVIGSYAQLEKVIGRDRVALPPKNDKGERDWSKWDGWSQLGRPDAPEAYQFQVPEGVALTDADKAFHAAMAPVLHQAGLAQWQLDILAGGFSQFAGKQAEETAAERAKAGKNGEKFLRAEWGQAYDANIAVAQGIVRNFGEKELKAELEATGLANSPRLAKLLVKLAEHVPHEGGALVGDKSGGGFGALSPAAAEAKIAEMEADPAQRKILNDRAHPEHKALVARRSEFYRAAHPETPRG
jgi:hypothetical protein